VAAPLTPVARLGLQIPNFTFPGVADADLFETVAGIATTAEAHGFDSVWVMDHLYQIEMVGPKEHPMLEAYTLLSALAARTRRVGLGTMVTGVTYRNPALLAKIVTTLDVISSGRAILGIGAAWNDDEHAGYGFDFPTVKERMDRLEEALQIIRAMFTEPAPSFEGRYYRINRVLNNPKPIRGRIPILIGGSVPIVPTVTPGGSPLFFNVYGGVTLDSWKQTLQGRDAGAPGGAGFFGQNQRFTVDPTAGVGFQTTMGGFLVGLNAELQFRPGSVVTAQSANFTGETYYGTVDPRTNLLLMARIGWSFGAP